MRTPWTITGIAALAVVSGGVVALSAAGPGDAAGAPAPTFEKDVLPIVQAHCQDCHRPEQMAPFSLLTYEDARPWARDIKDKVVSRYMPPWHVDRTVGEYDPDPSLTDAEIQTIARWVDAGAPKGDPKTAPPPRVFPDAHSWQFGEEPDLVIEAPAVDVPAIGPDVYPEPEVPTGLTEDRYIKWIQIIPEHTQIIHHVLVFAEQNRSANGTLLTAAGSPGSAAAQGGSVAMVAEYARGNDGDIYKDGEGKLLQAGSTIRFQQHIHPDTHHSYVEHTKVGIKFFPKGYTPKHLIVTRGVMSPGTLAVPPGDPNARSDAYFRLQEPARLVSFQPHMHYRGKRMTLEAILPSGQVRLLSDVPHFIWTWQITYTYKHPITLPKDTVLHVTAYHDNSAANRENPDPTAFVGWGDRTVDEMNIGWIDFYYITDQEYADLMRPSRGPSARQTAQQ